MKAIRSRGLKAASVAVLGSITLAAGLAASVAVASNQSSTKAAVSAVSNANPTAGLPAASVAKALASIRQQKAPGCTTATAPHGAWQHLGGNPALLGGAWTKGAFQAFINSARGKTYLNLALDYNAAQVAQVVRMVREDNFEKSTVNYCDLFPREAFGRNGPTLTKNVTFLDSTYRYHGAPA